MPRESVYTKHGGELSSFLKREKWLLGRLHYAMCILSDVQEILSSGYSDHDLAEEVDEAKELIADIIRIVEAVSQKLNTGTTEVRLIVDNADKIPDFALILAGFKFKKALEKLPRIKPTRKGFGWRAYW